MFILGIVVTASVITIAKILGALAVAVTGHKLLELVLPGNEAKLMETMQKLKLKKGSAEAQFLKELTLTETAAMAREFQKEMANDRTGTNNMLQAIMSQDTGFRKTIPPSGADQALREGVPGVSAPLPQRQLRGSRSDVESMQAAISSLRSKTADADRIPATLRLTGRPTHG